MICRAPGSCSSSSSFGILKNIHSAGRSNDVSYTPAYRMKGKFRLVRCKDSRATYAPGQRLVWGSMREAGLAGFYRTPASGPDAGQAAISYIPATERREHARAFKSAMESHPPRMGPLRRLHVAGIDPHRRKVGAPDLHLLARLLRNGVSSLL